MQVKNRAQGYQVNESVRKHVDHVDCKIFVAHPGCQVVPTYLYQRKNGKGTDDCDNVAEGEDDECDVEEASLLCEGVLSENAAEGLGHHVVEDQ